MARWSFLLLVASGVGFLRGPVRAGYDDPIALRDGAKPGTATRVAVMLKAEGSRPDYRVEAKAKPLPFRVETHFDFLERVLDAGADGRPTRVVRRAERATAAIDFFRAEGQAMAADLRPEVALLVAERRPTGLLTFSAGGPLLRSELDLVQGPADPLALAELLPAKPAAVGDSWDVPPEAAKALSEYEALAANGLKATLTSADASEARIAIKGQVRGAARGGEGTMDLDGSLTFDRKANLIRRLEIKRSEVRKKGLVESALEAKSTLTVDRTPVETPAELSDEALKELTLEGDANRELLVLVPPGGRYTLLHDRDWHLAMDDARRVVLKRIDHGELVAQCDLMIGPNAGRGRHQDLAQFRDDVRKALGKNFESFTGAGEVGGAAEGGFRYKVAVEGTPQEGGRPLWYYYLVASPEGDQLLAVFSLTQELEPRFGDQDLRLIGSLEWRPKGPGGSAK